MEKTSFYELMNFQLRVEESREEEERRHSSIPHTTYLQPALCSAAAERATEILIKTKENQYVRIKKKIVYLCIRRERVPRGAKMSRRTRSELK